MAIFYVEPDRTAPDYCEFCEKCICVKIRDTERDVVYVCPECLSIYMRLKDERDFMLSE